MENKDTSLMRSLLNRIKRSDIVTISIVLIALIIIACITSPYFLGFYNLQSLLRDLAFIGMISIAQALLLIVGELDLSVSQIASLCGVIAGMMMVKFHIDPYVSLLTGVALGLLCGMVNGLLVTRLRLNSMVTTIGMSGIYGGIILVITEGKAITGIPSKIFYLGLGNIGIVPIPFLFTVAILIGVLFMMYKTKTGRYIYAIGNSRVAAKILGIKVNKIRVILFTIVGAVSSIAGLLYAARLGNSQSDIGDTWAMNSIASSVIGGVALTGGTGNPFGALIGASIISIIQNIIVLVGVDVYWQSVVSGVVIVLAISFGSVSIILSERRQRKQSVKNSEKNIAA